MLVRARQEGLDGGHAPAGIALVTGEASGLLDAWASSPSEFYAVVCGFRPSEKARPFEELLSPSQLSDEVAGLRLGCVSCRVLPRSATL
jgi:hypothetical protein